MSAVCLKPGSGCLLQVLRSVFTGMQFPVTIYCWWSWCRSCQPLPGVVWCPFMGCTLCWLSKMSQDKLGHEENKRIIQLNQWKSTREGAGSLGSWERPYDQKGISWWHFKGCVPLTEIYNEIQHVPGLQLRMVCGLQRHAFKSHQCQWLWGFFTLKPPYTASADVVCNHLKLI